MRKVVSKLALAAGVSLAMALTLSCSSPDDDGGNPSSSSGGGGYTGSYGSVTYEGQTYKTVKIGSQTWFAENLNYDPGIGRSACYDNQASNCVTYGRLYNWATAMALPSGCNGGKCSDQIQSPHQGICPSGWHIPGNAEWDKLYRYVDGTSGTESPYGSETAGKYLKSTSGWPNDWRYGDRNGTDQYGFSALPAACGCGSGGSFVNIGYSGDWWSANEYNSNYAYNRSMDEFDYADWGEYGTKGFLFSVRCVQD